MGKWKIEKVEKWEVEKCKVKSGIGKVEIGKWEVESGNVEKWECGERGKVGK